MVVPGYIAILAKEKGFKEWCSSNYWIFVDDPEKPRIPLPDPQLFHVWENKIANTSIELDKVAAPYAAAPTHQQLIDWLREKHKIHIGIVPYYDYFYYIIKDFKGNNERTSDIHVEKPYYELLEEAIEEALKIII